MAHRSWFAAVMGSAAMFTGCGEGPRPAAAPPSAPMTVAEESPTADFSKSTAAPQEKQQYESDEEAVASVHELVSRGEVERAEKLLRRLIAEKPDVSDFRVELAQLLAYDGRPDEAAESLQDAAKNDAALLLFLGDIRYHQAREGRNVVNKRGISTTSPSFDTNKDAEFKQRHYQLAREAYSAAAEIDTEDVRPRERLAVTHEKLKDFSAALDLWRKLAADDDKTGRYHAAIARCLAESGDQAAAAAAWRDAIEANPRSAEAYAALAKHHRDAGEKDEAELCERRAKFYERLPAFATLTHSDENEEIRKRLHEQDTVERLLADPSPPASEWLAILCWTHPHNQLEDRAFAELGRRGAGVIPLVKGLFDSAGSTCTIRQSAQILAQAKTPGLYERLAQMLPHDLRGFGFEMDIAGALGMLGDPRAIGPLVNLLDADNQAEDRGDPMHDRTGGRARAALALAAFDDPAAKSALAQGFKNPRLAAACGVALFRKTRDAKYLEPLKRQIQTDKLERDSFSVVSKLRDREEPEAKEIVQRWEALFEAKDKQREKEGRLIRATK